MSPAEAGTNPGICVDPCIVQSEQQEGQKCIYSTCLKKRAKEDTSLITFLKTLFICKETGKYALYLQIIKN